MRLNSYGLGWLGNVNSPRPAASAVGSHLLYYEIDHPAWYYDCLDDLFAF